MNGAQSSVARRTCNGHRLFLPARSLDDALNGVCHAAEWGTQTLGAGTDIGEETDASEASK